MIEQAARRRGIETLILTGYRAPEDLRNRSDLSIYAEHMFADVIASQLDLALLEAPLDWLTTVPMRLLGRTTERTTLGRARHGNLYPLFVKALDDKRIDPRVYQASADLPGHVDDETAVLVSRPVHWEREIRLFVLGGVIQASSVYIVDGRSHVEPVQASLAPGLQELVSKVHEQTMLPAGTVLDVGVRPDGTMDIIEANAAWTSGLYACDPNKALDCILAGSVPRSRLLSGSISPSLVREAAEVDFA